MSRDGAQRGRLRPVRISATIVSSVRHTERRLGAGHTTFFRPSFLVPCLLTVLPLRCYAPPLAPAAFNDPFIDAEYAAYMFKYDTVVRAQSGQGCKVARLLVGCNGSCSGEGCKDAVNSSD